MKKHANHEEGRRWPGLLIGITLLLMVWVSVSVLGRSSSFSTGAQSPNASFHHGDEDVLIQLQDENQTVPPEDYSRIIGMFSPTAITTMDQLTRHSLTAGVVGSMQIREAEYALRLETNPDDTEARENLETLERQRKAVVEISLKGFSAPSSYQRPLLFWLPSGLTEDNPDTPAIPKDDSN